MNSSDEEKLLWIAHKTKVNFNYFKNTYNSLKKYNVKDPIKSIIKNSSLTNANMKINRDDKKFQLFKIAQKFKNSNKTTKVSIHGVSKVNSNLLRIRNKNTCPTGRIQIGGTCWFQAILNGWILSPIGRKYMKQKLEAFKKSNEMKRFTNIQACPMRGKLPVYFWSYVEYMIQQIENPSNNINYNVKVQLGLNYKHNELIRNAGLRNKNINVYGGNITDLRKFIKIVFDYDIDVWNKVGPFMNKRMFIHKVVDGKVVRNRVGYKLSHAYIAGHDSVGGHAICGYHCPINNKYLMFDSNFPDTINVDWTRDIQGIKNHFKVYFPNPDITIFAVYIKNTFNPLKSNNTRKPIMNRVKKLLNRK